MIRITKIIEFDAGHRVPNHKSKCRNPHGHRYRLECTVSGYLNSESGSSEQGMVIDFGDLKDVMTTYVHDVLDHGFIYYENDKEIAEMFEPFKDTWNLIKVPFIPTAEELSRWCFEQVNDNLPPTSGLELINVKLFETPNSWAQYGM
jgi:6-pyruvoyltetrahydropterin/6-carboxytetrahydropterin synthase